MVLLSSASSYSEMPASAPPIRASYRLTWVLSSTVTLMIANCARSRRGYVSRVRYTAILPINAGILLFAVGEM